MNDLIAPGLDTRGLVSAGPLSFAQTVKIVQGVFTYAELVAIGVTPTQVIGAAANKIILPIYFVGLTQRTNVTAGTTVPIQLRHSGAPQSLMAANVSTTFANAPGATLLQFNAAADFSLAGTFAANVDFRNRPIMFVPTANHLATGCAGSFAFSIAYIEFPIG